MKCTLRQVVTTAKSKEIIDRAFAEVQTRVWGRVKTPSEQGKSFTVPLLAFKQGDLFEPFEETHLLEYPWSLANGEATLPGYEGPHARGQAGTIDMTEAGQVQTAFVSILQQQMLLLSENQDWNEGELVRWLDRTIPHQDILPHEARVYLTCLIRHLTTEGGFTLDQLVHDKFNLRHKIEARIEELRKAARKTAHQALLFSDDPPVGVHPKVAFSFPSEGVYHTFYSGGFAFQKHYYPHVGDLNGEEERCAQFIDQMPEVEYWVRNPERQPRHAFWLQTSTDRFYPDFVCALRDGRYFAVEYKGENLWSNDDSVEKRAVGEVWEARSEGRCLFTMPKGLDFDAIRVKVEA